MNKLSDIDNKKQPPIKPLKTDVETVIPKNSPKGIPIEDLIALCEDNPKLSENQLAKVIGISGSVMSRRLRSAGYSPRGLKNYKKYEASIWDFHASRILNSVSPKDIKKATMLQKYTAAGICKDKAMIERGQMPMSQEKLEFHVVFNDNRQVNITSDRHNDKAIDCKPVDNSEADKSKDVSISNDKG